MQVVPRGARITALRSFFALLALTGLAAAVPAAASATAPGGVSARSGLAAEPVEGVETETGVGTEEEATAAVSKARIVNGRAIAPLNAPPAVRMVIAAANKIRSRPYIWGGGHGRWWDRGYDCSGAVSFALHGGKLLTSPLTSGSMETFGSPGPGRWITIYANAAHAYAVIAGLRWDTAGDEEGGTGPRWHESTVAAAGGRFVARHPTGY